MLHSYSIGSHIETLPDAIQVLVKRDLEAYCDIVGIPLDWDDVKRERLYNELNLSDTMMDCGLREDRYEAIVNYYNQFGIIPRLFYDIETDKYLTLNDLYDEFNKLYEYGEIETDSFADYLTNCTAQNGTLEEVR